MGNTGKRVISAAVLIFLLVTFVFLGQKYMLGLSILVGIIIIDEIFCNFLKKSRKTLTYGGVQLAFVIPIYLMTFIYPHSYNFNAFLYVAILFNLFMLFFLFVLKMDSPFMVNCLKKIPFLISIMVLFPLLSLGQLLYFDEWRMLLAVLVVLNFGTDSGAWFFGINWGKRKLFHQVSPNKTFEGLLGGMLIGTALGVLCWRYFYQREITGVILSIFPLLCLLSQLGDLVQSKIKRQFSVKDSSSLIPGHGGVYDRMDGLVFLLPFFLLAIKVIG